MPFMISWKVRKMVKYDLTLAKIRNTDFASLYDRLIVGEKLSQKQYEILLAIAICFTNADDTNVQQLGYRIVVEYCNQANDYIPLYEIAVNKGLYPVSKFIEQHYTDDSKRNFFTEWNDAFTEQYVSGEICRSEQQNSLVHFFESKKDNTVSVIAPTSYGKSELIISAVKEYAGKRICVLTSTKALLIQTKKRVQQISKGIFPKIVVHPEMYNPNDPSCLAVLTQERLLRIFKKDPQLSFDCIIVDEAHEMLEDDNRSRTLANVIIVAQKRNPEVAFKFLTPFLVDSTNLKARYTTYDIEGFKVSEYIKTEKYFLCDLRNHTGLKLYDQFLNKYLPISDNRNLGFEEDVVKAYSAGKNIIYLNKPTDIEKFALALADVLPEVDSELIQTACDNISEYLQPQYNLLTCLRKGIIYHHGSVPDAIRIYIEDLYKKDDAVRYVITSSTLLSGVNLPAERMFILDNKRGRSNLSHDSFKNLVGRVCRFSEIFSHETGNLHRLEPQIYLVFGKYFAQNANCESFLRNVAKVEQNYKDAVDNVLLSEAKITADNEEKLRQASEFIENYENGVVEDYQERYTNTVAGKACIMNGITEFDVFAYEVTIQQQVDAYQGESLKISDSNTLLETINELFIQHLPDNGAESLKRLENKEARNFYSMMFEWRVKNKSYAEMISLFVGYWHQLYKKDRNVMVYVGKWGDVKRPGSNVARYTKFVGKNRAQIVNLAIVRIKEEQDFIDNTLIKYVEVLHDLDLIEDGFYAQIKYGTDDERTICLIKNGLSLSSAMLLMKKYGEHLQIDIPASTVVYGENLVSEMIKAEENQIQIYEIQSCM
ncbi:MAG: DEAD/DEAH box helicase [Lachnospiraceae bacterium]|nr:DEAD/DEAH box helicase [Lachnospiraceae bacterium]